MKLSVSLNGFEGLSRRLALGAARRADALVHPAPARVVVSEEPAPAALGAEAWPGAIAAGATPRDTDRGLRL
jgi:hypothetical protein